MVREELRIELRAALQAAREGRRGVRTQPIAVRFDGERAMVTLHVQPALQPQQARFTLVIFNEAEAPAATLRAAGATAQGDTAAEDTAEPDRLRELRDELDLTRQRLQTIIDENEASQEEMKAANEELQSTNEELRSTMEELETSKEELQSMNEELQTVNQENRHKVDELAQLTGDLQNLLAATDIATLFLDRDLRIMRFTPKVSELFNVRVSDSGRPLSDFTHRLGYQTLIDDARAVFARLIPLEREVQDNSSRWYLVRVLPYRSPEERIEGVVMTFVDITQRKAAEERLRQSEQRLRVLVEAASQTVWEANADGVVVEDSPGRRAYSGQKPHEWLGYGWLNSVHPDDRESAERQWRESVSAGRNVDAEFRVRGPDGSWRWTNVRAAPIRDADGRITKWIAMNLDITDRKQAELTLRDADQRKEDFMATLAHELRNPLATIRNGLTLLRIEHGSPAAIQGTREMMERQLDQLVRLVDDLLDVNRINRGVMSLRRGIVDVGAIVRRAVEGAQPRLQENRRLELVLPPGSLWVDADAVRLTQVIGNLLDNATKFTKPGDRITVRVTRHEQQVAIAVEDEGIGIPGDKLAWIFEMFSQVQSAPLGSVGGLGIGLTLVRRLVELHGGTVEARSEGLGRGSTFVIRLPLVRAPASAAPATEEDATGRVTGLRFLVVDDNRDTARSLAMILKLAGNEVRTAHDGAEAVSAAEAFRPDVAVLDIGLPVFDGREVVRRIRAQAWGRDMLVVAVTGWGRADDKAQSVDAGFDGHLVKPVDPRVLTGIVARLRAARPDRSGAR